MAGTTTAAGRTEDEPKPIRVTTGGHVAKYAERALHLLEVRSAGLHLLI